jgi:hypothetical protein
MSTVRPFTSNCTGGGGALSTLVLSAGLPAAGLAGAGAAMAGERLAPMPEGPRSTSQV